jgi:hypothetical protein
MKKAILSVALGLLVSVPCHAENVQQEAVDSLATAQKFVQDGNYNKAIEEVNYALAKINELTAEKLLEFIPDAPAGFTLVNKQSQGVGAAASIAGSAGATAQYSHSSGATVDVNIALGGMTGKMGSLAALGSIFAGLGGQQAGGEQMKQVRVQGYTGTQMFNSADGSGTLTFQIGDKTSVTFQGEALDSPDKLMELAKSFDFAAIEKGF